MTVHRIETGDGFRVWFAHQQRWIRLRKYSGGILADNATATLRAPVRAYGESPGTTVDREGRRCSTPHRPKTASLALKVGTPQPKHVPVHHTGGPAVAFQLRDSQQVEVTVEALDSEDNPAAVDVTWASSDDSIVSVTGSGNTATITASPGAGGLGTATVTATATDQSDGDTHEGTFEVEVVAGDAVIVNITAGTPTDKPAAGGGGGEPPVEPPVEPNP